VVAPPPNVDEMVGKLITPTQVTTEKMAIAFEGDEDELECIVNIKYEGNIFSYLVDCLGSFH
jgi:hypothetical protein